MTPDNRCHLFIIAMLLLAAFLLIFYFHGFWDTGRVFTHLFYIPIILAALWWPDKELVVPLLLGGALITGHHVFRTQQSAANDCLRAAMFVTVAWTVSWLRRRCLRSQFQLRSSQRRYASLVDSVPDIVYQLDCQGRIVSIGGALEELTGFDPGELVGRPITVLVSGEPGPPVYWPLHERRTGLRAARCFELAILRKPGDGRPSAPLAMELSACGLYDRPPGQPRQTFEGTCGILRDVSARKRTEQALADSEERFRLLAENAPIGLSISNPRGTFEYINPAFTGITGYTLTDLGTEKAWCECAYPDMTYRRKVFRLWNTLKRSGATRSCQVQVRCKGGDDKFLRFNEVSMPDGRHIVTTQDITSQVKAEAALRKSRQRYRHLFDKALVGLYRVRLADLKLIECNAKATEITGYAAESQPGGGDCLTAACIASPKIRRRFLHLLATGGSADGFEARLTRKDGSLIWARFSARSYPDEGYVEGVVTDVSERKRAEENLQRSYAILAAVFEGIAEPLFVLDRQLKIHLFNRATIEYYRSATNRKEAEGKACHLAFKGRPSPCEGCRIPLMMDTDTRATFDRVNPFFPERQERITIYPLKGLLPNGCSGVIVHILDITEKKWAEEQLIRADRLASLGQLSAGVAHEIRNPLSVIRLFTDVLQDAERFVLSAQVRDIVSEIACSTERISEIINRVLSFAAPSSDVSIQVDINELVKDTMNLWRQRLDNAKIALNLTLTEDSTVIVGDPVQLQQLFNNLMLNAIEVMPSGGTIGLSTTVGKSSIHRGRRVLLLEIADSGPGIEPQQGSRIFDPFFTTKAHGTGLGLSISHRIVERHGGVISFKSPPGQGTTFTVELPSDPVG